MASRTFEWRGTISTPTLPTRWGQRNVIVGAIELKGGSGGNRGPTQRIAKSIPTRALALEIRPTGFQRIIRFDRRER